MGTNARDQTDLDRRGTDRRVAADPAFKSADRRKADRRTAPRPAA